MYALGAEGPPQQARLNGRTLELQRVVKHDFWAATCFYRDPDDDQRVVIKFGRTRRLGILPMRWAGRILVERESGFYCRLTDVPAVPRWLGRIEDSWIAFAHVYIEGEVISQANRQRLDEGFFTALASVLEQLHDRGIAYIDLHKEQNIIIDAAGKPHLIDFQISYDSSGAMRRLLPSRLRQWLLSVGIRADRYHLIKHKKFLRPDLLSPEERERVERRVWFIRLHARLVFPYRFVRRRLLKRWRSSGRLLPDAAR